MSPTADELRLLGLTVGAALPSGGDALELTVCCGSGTADTWTKALGPFFLERYGIKLEPGSFNLWSEKPIDWVAPLNTCAADKTWDLCPLILEERAIGVAFRANTLTPRFLEVLAPVRLRTVLDDAKDGDRVLVRLLPGSALGPAI